MADPTFFDQEVTPLRNQIDSYYSKDVKINRLTQKEKVLMFIKGKNGVTQRELHELTGIPRHLISRTVKNLLDEVPPRIIVAGSIFDKITNRDVTIYKGVLS